MASALRSLIDSGTKLWLDSIDPELVKSNRQLGATGATSNPIIIADLIKTGRFDNHLNGFFEQGLDDENVAWAVTNKLVCDAQEVFVDIHKQTNGNDGYVSFELDPLLEDPELAPPHADRVAQYIELGRKWAKGHTNRMIKIPATPAGLDSVETLAADGITLNVTLVFSPRQYHAAREAVWRGAQKRKSLDGFKSVYSIFVSRVDVYTEKNVPELSDEAQGMVGIVNAQQIWADNQKWWADKNLPLQQEIIFASTGTKKPNDPKDKYIAALAGSDIQTNPPATNDAVEQLGNSYTKQVDKLPSQAIIDEIAAKVDVAKMEETLMSEGTAKFADPHKALIALIASKREALTPA